LLATPINKKPMKTQECDTLSDEEEKKLEDLYEAIQNLNSKSVFEILNSFESELKEIQNRIYNSDLQPSIALLDSIMGFFEIYPDNAKNFNFKEHTDLTKFGNYIEEGKLYEIQDIINYFLKFKIAINHDFEGETFFSLLVAYHLYSISDFLLEKSTEVDVDCKVLHLNNRVTCLERSILELDIYSIDYLLKNGADIEKCNPDIITEIIDRNDPSKGEELSKVIDRIIDLKINDMDKKTIASTFQKANKKGFQKAANSIKLACQINIISRLEFRVKRQEYYK
jgi:hypothetical protein